MLKPLTPAEIKQAGDEYELYLNEEDAAAIAEHLNSQHDAALDFVVSRAPINILDADDHDIARAEGEGMVAR